MVQLIVVGGSPQGAKPKALVMFDIDSQTISTDLKQAYQHGTDSASPWLIKFPAQHDDKSVCLLEALYADMATRAGLVMPSHHYFDIDSKHESLLSWRILRLIMLRPL